MNGIRSYVVRMTRMSDHQKHAYERLQGRYCIPFDPVTEQFDPDEETLDWYDLFPHRREQPDREIIMDIGFGMGRELAELADRRRDQDFIGVEVHKPGVGKLLSELERRSLENVRVVRYDAVQVCRYLIPRSSLTGIHLFFPDPWPKKRHHKRRLVRPGFSELVVPLLRPGGYLYLVTDWEDYAYQMVRILEESRDLKNLYAEDSQNRFAPPRKWRPQTAFERKGLAKGHRIYELVYERAQ